MLPQTVTDPILFILAQSVQAPFIYFLRLYKRSPHSYLITHHMPNVSVAVLNYFEDDLGRLVCDRSLQK